MVNYQLANGASASQNGRHGFHNAATSSDTSRSKGHPAPLRSSSVLLPRQARVYRCPPRDRPLYSLTGEVISIHASDGNACYWPTTGDPDDPDIISWHQAVDQDDPAWKTWNVRIAKNLAKTFDLGEPVNEWVLSGFPEGYRMFRRHDRQYPNDSAQNYIFGEEAVE